MTPSSILSATEEEHALMVYLKTNQTFVYVQIAAISVLIFHICSTFNIEARRMWKARLNRIALLYYLIRYLPPICITIGLWVHASYDTKYVKNLCLVWGRVERVVCVLMAPSLAELLMVMRTLALYENSKRMLLFLCAIFIGRAATGYWAARVNISSLNLIAWTNEDEGLAIPGCPSEVTVSYEAVRINCIYNMLAAGVLLLCMLNQCLARDEIDKPYLGTWKDLFGIKTSWPLVHILIRDGCMYFGMIFCTQLFILILISGRHAPFMSFSLPMMQAAYSIASTTLVLNLRAELHNDHSEGGQLAADIALDCISCIDFAPRMSYDAATGRPDMLKPTCDDLWLDGSELHTEDVTDAHSFEPSTTFFHEDIDVTQGGLVFGPACLAGAEILEDVESGIQRSTGSNLSCLNSAS